MRIPYDAFVLESVVDEIRQFVGGRLQGARQPNATEFALELYGPGEGLLLVSVHAEHYRAHFVTRRPANSPQPPQFVATVRSRLVGATLESVEQPDGDRILVLTFEGDSGIHRLVIELMGKHSNAMLLDDEGRIVVAMKWLGPSKSSRPIGPGRMYERPPTTPGKGGSRFYRRLLEANEGIQPKTGPVLVPNHGAYPLSVAALGLAEHRRATISIALEQHYDHWIRQSRIEADRHALLVQIERAILAREVIVAQLTEALANEGKAAKWQRFGELILAYGPHAVAGSKQVEAYDYDGESITIPVDPDLDFRSNANLYFGRAKKAKQRAPMVRDQLSRTRAVLDELRAFRTKVADSDGLEILTALREEATRKKWSRAQAPGEDAQKAAHDGHRIRELIGPKGSTIFFGDNAEANDFLTLRLAKGDDWWLHVRGHTSAHVVVPTQRKPERIPQEDLLYAAQVAVSNSSQKHGSYVPVDLTLKKYVRKPRGSARGAVVYTHERTVYVDPLK